MATDYWGPGGSGWMSGGSMLSFKKSSAPSRGGGSTARSNAAASARLTAQGNAYKRSGQLSRDGKTWMGPPNPQAALDAWLAAHDTTSGGGGGGYGGGGGGGGADFGAMRSNADSRYRGQQGQLDDLYGDYAKLIAGNPAATKAAYAALIANSAKAGAGIASQANAQANAQDAQRDAGLTSLGVSQEAIDASPSETKAAQQTGQQQLAQQNASWGNLQGVLGAAQESRDKLDIQGVQDAKVLAHRQLTQNYEDFMRQLDAQLAASYSGGGGGSSGGGGGGTTTNKYRDKMEDAIFDLMLRNAGYKDPGWTEQKAPAKPKTTTTYKYNSQGKIIGSTKSTTQ